LDALRSSAARGESAPRTGEGPGAPLSEVRLEPQALAERERTDAPSSTARHAEPEGRCRVLLVDDDDLVRTHVANVLERSGYRVGEAASGEEALRALHGGDYGIMITDWQMPGMSGLELCRELRAGVENRDLYVMMLTMSDRPEHVDLSRAAGADAYLLKSAPNEEIIARMAAARRIARQRSSSLETARV